VSPAGGTPVAITTVNADRQEAAHRFPDFLPDGRRFLFFVRSPQPERRGIYIGSLDSRDTKHVVRTNLRGFYDPSGFMLFAREGALMVQAVDPRRFDLTGDPIQVAPHVGGSSADYAAFSVSDTGTLAYASGNPQDGQLTWYDRHGASLGVVGVNGDYVSLQISPDQSRIAFSRVDPETNTPDLWLFDVARRASSRFTFDPSTEAFSVWSPDGTRIVFRSDRGGSQDLYVKGSSGAAPEQVFLASTINKMPTDWSSDGRSIVYHAPGTTTGLDLWVLAMSGDHAARPFLQTPFNEMQGRLSPDGHWMAYTSDESGALEVYVRPFPSGAEKWLISTGGGSEPAWRRDSHELFYLAADRKLMAVSIKSGAMLEAGVPSALFETHVGPINPEYRNQYSASSDGTRFLINTVSDSAPSSPITVVLNWQAGLKK
jgi:Tol biopolymer transport system component